MQKLNILDFGLYSKRIAMEIKKRVMKQFLGVSGKFVVMIDESTIPGSKSTLMAYLK